MQHHLHISLKFSKCGKHAKTQLNKTRKPSDYFAFHHIRKKMCAIFHLNTKALKQQWKGQAPLQRNLLNLWSSAKQCIFILYENLWLFLLKESKVHSTNYHNLQSNRAKNTNFTYRVGDSIVLRKYRKVGFLFDFSYRWEHVDACGSGMKVFQRSKHCSEQVISPGVILLHFPGTQSGLDQSTQWRKCNSDLLHPTSVTQPLFTVSAISPGMLSTRVQALNNNCWAQSPLTKQNSKCIESQGFH